MEYQDIIYTKEAGIATITLNRPGRRNAFSPRMSESIFRAVEDAAEDDSVRVLVLTGAGQTFCAGADVKAMAEKFDRSGRVGERDPTAEDIKLYPVLHNFRKPIIAAINGIAVGGGLDIALACDIRIASDKARFSSVFVRRGLVPSGGGAYILPRLIGIDRACHLIWTGDMVDAREAERIGLVTMVVPDEELWNATMELAEKLAKGPPLAIQKAKRIIYEGLHMDLDSVLESAASAIVELKQTEDHREGATAFVEKREPVFNGK
ncbi:enoyl-CoA hydratase/isomerase family protein [Chloroflexota bacterium]